MILDQLAYCAVYEKLSAGFARAFTFLQEPETALLPDGVYHLDADRLKAIVTRKTNDRKPEPKLEAHKRYIDIHYIFSGSEPMGWKPTRNCLCRVTDFDAENDYELFADAPDEWFTLRAGQFAILFPQDAHSPASSDELLHKVVFKVEV